MIEIYSSESVDFTGFIRCLKNEARKLKLISPIESENNRCVFIYNQFFHYQSYNNHKSLFIQ
jgi:hypothetical protein